VHPENADANVVTDDVLNRLIFVREIHPEHMLAIDVNELETFCIDTSTKLTQFANCVANVVNELASIIFTYCKALAYTFAIDATPKVNDVMLGADTCNSTIGCV
jgi:hypothetical protein